MIRPTAIVADDEPLLRDAMVRMLADAWPELLVIGHARNGREAIEMFDTRQPTICFLDVQMPGKTGVEAAQYIGRRSHVVFVTAFDEYAVQAFAQGALDYLVKPVEPPRLEETVKRLKERLAASQPALNTDALLQQLARAFELPTIPKLRWLRASIGPTIRLIDVKDVDFMRSEEKYTMVAWRDESGAPQESAVRIALKDLVPQLDDTQFAQTHRSVVVNLKAISHVTRGENETAEIHLKGRDVKLPVSRTYLHLFKQM